jgi:hypothetical protein
MVKKVKKILDPKFNNNRRDTYLNYSIILREELKAIQRSIALLKQEFPKILRDELTRLKGNEY